MARDSGRYAVLRLLIAVGSAGFVCAVPTATALAQDDDDAAGGAVSQAVVQRLPNRDSLTLNEALARLGHNPRDVDALIEAGKAALAMGDVEAALGFFRRAGQILPGNPRVKAGLAGALVRSENPFDAIPMFEEAERAGGVEGTLVGEWGLAYDLVGDNEKAQRYYRLALAQDSSDEVTRRLALSFAIAGDRRAAEATLAPMLQRQDKAAWRTRAFVLAILGQVEEAVTIANATLPPALSAGISPYLRYMPKLTPAQQAAAANLGHFPRASEIGRDDPRLARYAPANPRRAAALASADSALIPKGEPLGRNARSRSSRQDTRARNAQRDAQVDPRRSEARAPALPGAAIAARAAVPQPVRNAPAVVPARQGTVTATAKANAGVVSGPSFTTLAVPGRSAGMPVAGPPAPRPVAAPSPTVAAVSPPAASSLPLRLSGGAVAPIPPASPPAPVQPEKPRSLADAFSEFSRPALDVAPVAGAVDVRRIRPSRQAAEVPGGATAKKPGVAKPAPPSHPSRIWVQVATGRNKPALSFDWRRMVREAAEALRGKQAFVSAWGQTNRLLTGPFPSEAAANAFMAQLRRGGIDGSFIWTSPAGQVVDSLAAK